jgi:hypothetical protein
VVFHWPVLCNRFRALTRHALDFCNRAPRVGKFDARAPPEGVETMSFCVGGVCLGNFRQSVAPFIQSLFNRGTE